MERNTVDVVVVGAGFSGLHALYRVRALGLTAVLLEAGSDVGGTWYFNRYPGARVDVESVDYSFSFSEELQQEWTWSERFADQAELLRYLKHVATRFDLWPDIVLDTRVASAEFQDDSERWRVTSADGRSWSSRYCILATGFLSAPIEPAFPGLDTYKGVHIASTRWPEDGVDLSGKRLGIIGTGSTGVQLLPRLAPLAASTHVFQRTPAYTVPLRNAPQSPEFEASVKSEYSAWRSRQRQSPVGAIAAANSESPGSPAESALDLTPEELRAHYERMWEGGGIIAFYLAFPDLLTDYDSNRTLAEFMAEKIRERVDDPELARKLTPTYPVMTKRLCADVGYFEAFNRDDVHLVDISGQALAFDRDGITVGGRHYCLDVVVTATGFDAITGAISRIAITGRHSQTLKSHWQDEIRTAAGIASAGFPNLFWVNGPGSSAADASPPLMAEDQMDVIASLIIEAESAGGVVEADTAFEDWWLEECTTTFAATLLSLSKSWYNGANVPGKVTKGMLYWGGPVEYLHQLQHARQRFNVGAPQREEESSNV